MLVVDLRDLQRGPVDTNARIAPDDPMFAGLDLELIEPVVVEGRLQETGDGEYFWRAQLHGAVRGPCRRCLTDVVQRVDEALDLLFTDDPDAGEASDVYPLPAASTRLDLSEVVREQLALAAPSYSLCRDDCAGLCPSCGADLNAGPCGCTPPAEPV